MLAVRAALKGGGGDVEDLLDRLEKDDFGLRSLKTADFLRFHVKNRRFVRLVGVGGRRRDLAQGLQALRQPAAAEAGACGPEEYEPPLATRPFLLEFSPFSSISQVPNELSGGLGVGRVRGALSGAAASCACE